MKLSKLLITLASLFLISCGGSGSGADKALSTDGVEARGRQLQNAATSAEVEALSPTGITWGRFSMDNRWQSDTQLIFQTNLIDFLSPHIKASDVGTVSGDQTDVTTGISFWGRGLSLNDGSSFDISKSYTGASNVFNEETSELRISIIQSHLTNGIQEIPIHFNSNLDKDKGQLIYSEISGNFVQLVFADSLGRLSLMGFIEQDSSTGITYYIGQVVYRNLLGIDGLTVDQEVKSLGMFQIKACGFFECSN